ncbi:MAG: type IV pilus secretin PilQ, partial [Pseudomonadales bacterium]|nr:type IV pilus secretin PilQ [Pseudomonadales bacterium]
GSTTTIWDMRDPDDDGTITFSRPDNLMVDLGVADSRASSFALGYSSLSTGLLELELSALESDGKADIIATPKVLTADQQTARIASGTEIPYQEASSSGATSVSFKEAVLSLEVTPHITPDGRIIMELEINQDTVGEIFNGIPSIDTNSISTNVLVDNGETIVLGGVYRTEAVESVAKTPFFGDLPIIGRFFRNSTKTDRKQELLIFITPKIVKDVLATR